VEGSGVTLRVATVEDAATLAELNHHVHDLHVKAEPDVYRPTQADEVAARFREVIATPDEQILIAEVDGAQAGYLVWRVLDTPKTPYTHARRVAHVDALAVAPSCRRRGVGRALMKAAAVAAAERHCSALQLDVRAHNAEARAFYEGLGYTAVQSRMARPL